MLSVATVLDSFCFFFFSSRRRHTRWPRDWSSDVCSSDLRTRQIASSPSTSSAESHCRQPADQHRYFLSQAGQSEDPVGTDAVKIGRASCRERGWGSGVDGGGKKKGERDDGQRTSER